MNRVYALLGLWISLLLTACVSDYQALSLEERLFEMGYELGEGNNRIPRYKINGWSVVDDSNLIIISGVNDRYLISLNFPCFNLRSAFLIGITTPTGRLDRFESIVVRGPGRNRERCNIDDIVRLYPLDN